jgi:hypothetical protein
MKGLSAISWHDLRQVTVLSALGLLGLIIKFYSAGLCGLSFFGEGLIIKNLLFICAILLFHSKGCFKILVLWVICSFSCL